MTDPSQLCPHEHRLHIIIHFGTLQHFIVRDLVLSFHTHKVPEMPHVEDIKNFHMPTIARPGLSSIQQGGENCCPVYLDHCVKFYTMGFPDHFLLATVGANRLADPSLDIVKNLGII